MKTIQVSADFLRALAALAEAEATNKKQLSEATSSNLLQVIGDCDSRTKTAVASVIETMPELPVV